MQWGSLVMGKVSPPRYLSIRNLCPYSLHVSKSPIFRFAASSSHCTHTTYHAPFTSFDNVPLRTPPHQSSIHLYLQYLLVSPYRQHQVWPDYVPRTNSATQKSHTVASLLGLHSKFLSKLRKVCLQQNQTINKRKNNKFQHFEFYNSSRFLLNTVFKMSGKDQFAQETNSNIFNMYLAVNCLSHRSLVALSHNHLGFLPRPSSPPQ